MRMLPWSDWKKQSKIKGVPITGPRDICQNEHLRLLIKDFVDWGPVFHKDCFIWAKGESEMRSTTKIGGLPYLPVDDVWPLSSKDGTPLPFLAQFNFSESKDLLNPGGDILLIFADIFQGYVRESHYKWISLSPDHDLIQFCDLPETKWSLKAHHGYRCRVECFPFASLKPGLNIEFKDPVINGIEVGRFYLLTNYVCSEIGSVPAYIQPFRPDDRWQPLCSVASLGPCYDMSYPWVNQKKMLRSKDIFKSLLKMEYSPYPATEEFMIDDASVVYVGVEDGVMSEFVLTH
jgi:hypothetical protein